jgi:hypothetical protein
MLRDLRERRDRIVNPKHCHVRALSSAGRMRNCPRRTPVHAMPTRTPRRGGECNPQTHAGKFIHITSPRAGATTTCRIDAKPSERPVFLKDIKGQQFHVCVCNQTVPMSIEEALNCCRVRWK